MCIVNLSPLKPMCYIQKHKPLFIVMDHYFSKGKRNELGVKLRQSSVTACPQHVEAFSTTPQRYRPSLRIIADQWLSRNGSVLCSPNNHLPFFHLKMCAISVVHISVVIIRTKNPWHWPTRFIVRRKKLNANRVLWTYFPTFVDLFSYTL